MKRLSIALLLFLVACTARATPAHADDIPVVTIDIGTLPFERSPSNFDNSPSNFDNSVSNFENSTSNFDNAPSNFDNSPSNYENRNGNHHVILNGRSIGYYVVSRIGVTNFFSFGGQRLFFNPKRGGNVYDANNGRFAGIIGRVNGVLTLGLDPSALQYYLMSR